MRRDCNSVYPDRLGFSDISDFQLQFRNYTWTLQTSSLSVLSALCFTVFALIRKSRLVEIEMENIASRRLFVSFESSWENEEEDMELEKALVEHFTSEYCALFLSRR